jgi:hypothetical protein
MSRQLFLVVYQSLLYIPYEKRLEKLPEKHRVGTRRVLHVLQTRSDSGGDSRTIGKGDAMNWAKDDGLNGVTLCPLIACIC